MGPYRWDKPLKKVRFLYNLYSKCWSNPTLINPTNSNPTTYKGKWRQKCKKWKWVILLFLDTSFGGYGSIGNQRLLPKDFGVGPFTFYSLSIARGCWRFQKFVKGSHGFRNHGKVRNLHSLTFLHLWFPCPWIYLCCLLFSLLFSLLSP